MKVKNLNQALMEENARLEEENKEMKEKVKFLEECLDRKEEVSKKMRREIKDHQLYEEKLEHRIIEFEELLH